jgi:glutamyl/glutaminyl-tRNA synthetase
LDWFNRRALGQMDEGEAARLMAPYWEEAYGVAHRARGTALAVDEWQRALAAAIRGEMVRLTDAADAARFCFVDEVSWGTDAEDLLARPYAPEVLEAFCALVESVEPFTFEALDAAISDLRRGFKASHGIRSRDVMYLLRAALTGRADGPCLVVACQLLGRERCLSRIEKAAGRARG